MTLPSFLRRERPEPLIHIMINGERLRENLAIFRAQAGKEVAPVLKSNAYGHGLLEVARALESEPAPFWVVDSCFEATLLRSKGFKQPLLVAGFARSETIVSNSLKNVSFVVGSTEQLLELASLAQHPIRIHLKIDTGMHRLGIGLSDIERALQIIKNSDALELEGLMSHFASADTDETATLRQIQMWNAIVSECKDVCDPVRYIHIAATAGHKYAALAAANCTRVGLGLYGLLPDKAMAADFPVQPVLSAYTILSSIRTITQGEKVGYGGTFAAPCEITIGTIPVGYFEGLDRRLSNKGFVRIGTSLCPIIGRISMNAASIDLSAVPTPTLGMKVEFISDDSAQANSVMHHATHAEMIPYEFLVHIPQHLRRELKN